MLTGHTDQDRLDKAIESLTAALDSSLWLDDNQLVPKLGQAVFPKEKDPSALSLLWRRRAVVSEEPGTIKPRQERADENPPLLPRLFSGRSKMSAPTVRRMFRLTLQPTHEPIPSTVTICGNRERH
jgi:hypothetical protein